MAGRLPGNLVDEARLTLDSVGRIELPPRAWPFVRGYLASIDCAVGADDAAALRTALDDLHRIGLGPRRNPDRAPSLGPSRRSQHDASSYSPTSAHRTPAPPPRRLPRSESASYPAPSPPTGGQRRRASRSGRIVAIAACMIGILVAAGFLVTLLVNSTAHQVSPPSGQTTTLIRPTQYPGTRETTAPQTQMLTPTETLTPGSANPTRPTTEAPPFDSAASEARNWVFAACLLTLAIIVLIAVGLLRRRSRSSSTPAHVEAIADRQNGPPDALPAPKEVVEFANRTVMRLVEYGGAS